MHQKTIQLGRYALVISIPFLIGMIIVLLLSNHQLQTALKMQHEDTKELYSLKGELRELLEHEKNNVVILDAFNARANEMLRNQLDQKRVLGAMTQQTASPEGLLAAVPLGLLQVKTNLPNDVAIYDSPLKTSILGTAKPEDILFFFKKEAEWYQIEPKSQLGKRGWVEAKDVLELSQ